MTFSFTSRNAETDDLSSRVQYLRFRLPPDTAAILPVANLTEVLTISLDRIVPISHLPAWVMGVYNWRGEILWIVDLGALLGLTPWYQKDTTHVNHRALVLRSLDNGQRERGQMLGLVVDRVDDIEWCNPDLIQSPPGMAITPELAPFLQGYWLKENGDMLVVLSPEAILAALPKS